MARPGKKGIPGKLTAFGCFVFDGETYICPGSPVFIGVFANHVFFDSKGLSSSKKEPPFLKWWLTSRDVYMHVCIYTYIYIPIYVAFLGNVDNQETLRINIFFCFWSQTV